MLFFGIISFLHAMFTIVVHGRGIMSCVGVNPVC